MPQVVKYKRSLSYFVVVDNAFSKDEVDKILDLEELQEFTKGKVGEKTGSLNKKTRNSDVSWLDFIPGQSDWIFNRFSNLLGEVNHGCFMYDIDGFDNFQFTKYKKNQHYNWHLDLDFGLANWERKISASVILSDPSEYQGGELEIIVNGDPDRSEVLKPNRGSIVFFASWMPHRVRPITSGVRKSLVCWVMGKRVC